MIIILSSDSTGDVLAVQGTRTDGTPGPAPLPRQGCTIRQVAAIPAGPGTLRWQAGALVRVPREEPAPQAITPAQMRKWASRRGLVLDAALIDGLPGLSDQQRADARIDLEYETSIRIDNPLVILVCATLGVDRTAAFREAARL